MRKELIRPSPFLLPRDEAMDATPRQSWTPLGRPDFACMAQKARSDERLHPSSDLTPIEGASVRMKQEKIKAIFDWPYLETPKDMRSFVGLSGVHLWRRGLDDLKAIFSKLCT